MNKNIVEKSSRVEKGGLFPIVAMNVSNVLLTATILTNSPILNIQIVQRNDVNDNQGYQVE